MTQDMVKMMSQDKIIGKREILSSSPSPWFSRFLRTMLLLLMMMGVGEMWGQDTPDYSGTYYIGTVDQTNGFYLCPTNDEYIFYDSQNDTYTNENNYKENTFLTTYKCKSTSNYDASNALWIIEKHPSYKNYYYIKHANKYLTYNEAFFSGNTGRVRVHLEASPADDNYALFKIEYVSAYSSYDIISKYAEDNNTYPDSNNKPRKYLNVNKGNKQSLKGDGDAFDGINTGGIIGLWTTGSSESQATGRFFLEDYITRPTIAFNSSKLIEITPAQSGTVTIKYTTDGKTPTSAYGETYSVPFAPPANTTTIKAIVIVDGEESNVATFTPAFFFGEDHKYLIQSQGNGWTKGDFQGTHFYMIPGDIDAESGKTKVNTTSMFRPSMQWYILDAGDNYCYIVHNDSRRIRYDSTNGIYLDTWDEGSANQFKFQIVESATAGTYNIIPYGETAGNIYFNKTGGNHDDRPLTLYNNSADGNSRWKFVKKDALVETAPFTVTDNNSVTYYKLQNKATAYYVAPPSLTGGAVTVSNATEADVVNSRNWYFEEAQVPSDADWLTWYYIRNAVTGDYLYYSGPETSNDDAAFITKGSLNETDENDMKRYRFTWARSVTVNNYFIVPQLLKNETLNSISGLNRNSTDLRINKSKSADGSLWQFVDPDYTVAPPSIVYNADVNTVSLSCTTPGATIYYTTNNTEATTSATDSGSSPITIDLKADDKENVTIIRAIAEVSGTQSLEAINNIIVQTTVDNANRPYLIRNNQNSWTVGDDDTKYFYYMIPCSDKTVNTSSIPQPAMEWIISLASEEAGERYLYFCNAKTGDYLYHTSSTISMKTPTEKETLESGDDNGFKFYLKKRDANASSHAGYSIVPYGATNFVSKSSGNNNTAAVKVEGTDNDYKRWNFVTKNDLLTDHNSTPPFTTSDGSSSTYYWIYNGNGGTHIMIPPASETGNVTASSDTDDATKKSGSWFFIKVQEPTDEDWVTYYKIINAETGKALYYAYTNNNSNCLKVGDYDKDDNTYKFAFIKSTVLGSYFIVPKSVIAQQSASISTFWRSGSDIKPALTTRGSNSNDVCWTFTKASLFCNNPEFVEEEGIIKIKCNTNGAKIYINTESDDNPTSESTLYDPTNPNNTTTQNWAITDQVRIKAIAVVSDGTNSASSSVFTLLNNPVITLGGTAPYIYNASPWEPGVTKVSIGESGSETDAGIDIDDYDISYSSDRTNVGTVTVTLEDKVEGNMYVWNASTTFDITPKDVTITADSDEKVYDGTALTKNSYTIDTELVSGESIESVTVTGSQTVAGSSDNVPCEAVIMRGETVVTTNYNITYTKGTLTVTPKNLTIKADDATKEYDGTALTKNSYTIDTELVSGESIESVTVTGSQTIAGTVNNVPSAAVIKNAANENVTSSYNITYTNGTLTVTKKALTITADSDLKEYDGTPLEKNSYSIEPELAPGDSFESVTVTGSQTQAGSSFNVPSAAVIKNAAAEVVTSSYDITYINGTLTVVSEKIITITADDATKVYDGTALTKNSYTVDTQLISGDSFESVTVTGSQTVAGSSDNVPSGAVIKNSANENVTGNYHIVYVNGTLTVTPKDLTIKADNATKVYDGTALTKNSYTTINNTELASGDSFESVTVTGSQTVAGSSDNVPSAAVIKNAAEEEVTSSYNITYSNGTLEVTPKTVKDDPDTSAGEGAVTIVLDIPEGGFIYDGNAKIPDVTVKDGDTEIPGGEDGEYTVSITNNTNAGTATVTISDKDNGNYVVSGTTTFTINPKSLGDGTLTPAADITIGVTKNADNTFTVTVAHNGNNLEEKENETDTEYDYSLASEGSSITKYYVATITGANNYTGSAVVKYANLTFDKRDGTTEPWSATFVSDAGDGDYANPTGITPYIVTAFNDDNTVKALSLDYIPEDVPVLLLTDTEVKGFQVLSRSGEAADVSANLLEVRSTDTDFLTATIYLLYKGEFVLNIAGTLPARKVFLPKPSGGSGSRLLIVESESPGIDTSHLSPLASQIPETWYSIDGRRLSGEPTKKGLYLKNGQKVVVR